MQAALLSIGVALLICGVRSSNLGWDLQFGAAIYFPSSGHVVAGGLASDPGVLVRFKPPAPGQLQFVNDFSTLWSPLAGRFVGGTLANSGEAGTDPLAVFAASTSPPRLVILDCHAFRIAAVPTLPLVGASAVFTAIAGLPAETTVYVGSNDGNVRSFSVTSGVFGSSLQLRCPISNAPMAVRNLALSSAGFVVHATAWFGTSAGSAASPEVIAANGAAGYRARMAVGSGNISQLADMEPATAFARNSTPIVGPGLTTRFAAQPPSPLMGFVGAMAASADGAALVHGLAGTSYDEYRDGGQLQGPTLMASAGADVSAATVAAQLYTSPFVDLVAAAVVTAPPAGAAVLPSFVGCAAADNLAFAEAGARVMCVPITVEPTTGAVRLGAPTLTVWSTGRNRDLTGVRPGSAQCRGDLFPATIAVPLANTSRILFLTSARTGSSVGGDAGRDVVIGDLVDVSVSSPVHTGSFVLPQLGVLGGGTVVSLWGAPALVQRAAASNTAASATSSPSAAVLASSQSSSGTTSPTRMMAASTTGTASSSITATGSSSMPATVVASESAASASASGSATASRLSASVTASCSWTASATSSASDGAIASASHTADATPSETHTPDVTSTATQSASDTEVSTLQHV
jgi:hypothetical protein